MADDFYPFVDSGDPAPDNDHIIGPTAQAAPEGTGGAQRDAAETVSYATRISIYDDMLSTPRTVVIEPKPVRAYLEEVTNTVYRCMKEQGGTISLMVIREIVENFIHAHFVEPIISILDGGDTIRFADQGPGIENKERAFEFGVTSANRDMKRYIRGTGSGFPMVQQYLEAAGGAVSIEDNLGAGTVVTVSVDPARVEEIKVSGQRGAAVRSGAFDTSRMEVSARTQQAQAVQAGYQPTYPNGTQPMPPQFTPSPAAGATPAQPYPAQPFAQPYPQPGAYPQQPFQPGFPQAGHEFSTYPQTAGQSLYYQAYPGQPMPAQTPAAGAFPISERGTLALSFLLEHGQAGPTELVRAYGQSGPTWSRELATLSRQGFTVKQGQKYRLTELGASWIQSH